MKMDFKIRIAQQSDSAELRDLYKNTVLVVNRRDYSPDEVEDWASCGDDLSNMCIRDRYRGNDKDSLFYCGC